MKRGRLGPAGFFLDRAVPARQDSVRHLGSARPSRGRLGGSRVRESRSPCHVGDDVPAARRHGFRHPPASFPGFGLDQRLPPRSRLRFGIGGLVRSGAAPNPQRSRSAAGRRSGSVDRSGAAARRGSRCVGADYLGLKPTMLVQSGDRVLRGHAAVRGQGRRPACRYVAPAAGTVAAIHRGDMRAFQSLVIDVDPADGPRRAGRVRSHSRPSARRRSTPTPSARCSSNPGLWTAFRTRPFSQGAARRRRHRTRSSSPRSTRIRTRRAVDVVLAGRERRFRRRRSPPSPSSAPARPTSARPPARASRCRPAERVVRRGIRGPASGGHAGPAHPSCSTRSHHGKTVWHIGYQDVAAIGRLVTTGQLDVERVISLAGPGVARPRLLRTRLGASLDDADARRIAARRAARHLGLGARRPHARRATSTAISAATTCRSPCCRKADERELFGWIAPGARQVLALGRRARATGRSGAGCR